MSPCHRTVLYLLQCLSCPAFDSIVFISEHFLPSCLNSEATRALRCESLIACSLDGSILAKGFCQKRKEYLPWGILVEKRISEGRNQTKFAVLKNLKESRVHNTAVNPVQGFVICFSFLLSIQPTFYSTPQPSSHNVRRAKETFPHSKLCEKLPALSHHAL